MKVARRDVGSNLPKKGFRKNKSGDHIYFYHEWNGRETGAYTKISHTKKMKDIGGGLLTAMKLQLKLEANKQVVDLVTCPMSKEEYLEWLVEQRVFSPGDQLP